MNRFKNYANFEEFCVDAAQIHEDLKDLLTMPCGGFPKTSDEAILLIMGKLADELPTSHKAENGYASAFSIAATDVAYKFPTPLSFGWRIYRKNNKETYGMRITISSEDAKDLVVLDKATELGYTPKPVNNSVK